MTLINWVYVAFLLVGLIGWAGFIWVLFVNHDLREEISALIERNRALTQKENMRASSVNILQPRDYQ